MPKAETQVEADAQAELSKARDQLLIQQSNAASQKHLLQSIEDISLLISRFRVQVSEFEKRVGERLVSVGIDPANIKIRFEVDGLEVLQERQVAIQAFVNEIENGQGLKAKSIKELNDQITQLESEVANDRIQRSLIQQLQKRMSSITQETQRLQTEIVNSETETVKLQDKLRADRLDSYGRLFELWKDEQRALELLYRPVQVKLMSGEAEERQLDFYIRRNVDINSWMERGNGLFDQRRGHPFGSTSKFSEEVEKILVPAWQTGDPATVKTAMGTFLKRLKDLKAESYLRQSISHAMMLEWVFDTAHITLAYGLRYLGTEIENLSPGTKGIVLLILYLAMDTEDSRPLIVDQPEENLDNESIYSLLAGYFRKAKQRRQVILITHNPNLVVNTDSEQVIVASASRTKRVFPRFGYESGALEEVAGIRKRVCSILEGGERAFLERERRYALSARFGR